ncbi:hypothetical protein CVIRNUC_001256 [Coccomyxa viridis]|uniref:GCF C-terminal domain-containing protein n=1 Tax=Coccomyxa viridis TaxID=1274662 RepID=A0AAV1HUA8_9CHLO|nr:hypothetical protein CVIRNUC_001256 [Coccomyxa viridis]
MSGRKFRKKVVAVEHDDGEEPESLAMPPSSIKAKQARQQKERKEKKLVGKGLLSFGDDEEGHGPVLAKEKAKFKVSGARAAVSPAANSAPAATQLSAPGEYSAERLKELKANTAQLPASKVDKAAVKAASSAVFKLSGSFKKPGAPQDDRFEPLIEPVEEDEEELQPPARPGASAAAAASAEKAPDGKPPARPFLPVEEDDDDPGLIPDEDQIRRAREKRERMRSSHFAPDYVPLEPSNGALSSKDAAAVTTVQAGSDSEDEAPEDAVRMSFLGKNPGKAPQRSVLAGLHEDHVEVDDEDDDRWVTEQIRKGARSVPSTSAINSLGLNGRAATRASATVQPESVAVAGAQVMKVLRDGLARLQATHSTAEKQLAKTGTNLAASIAAVATLERDLKTAGAKFAFLQDTRAYIADLCDMLQHKSPIVEELEDRLRALGEHRARAAAQRAEADKEEEERPANAAVKAAMGVIGRGGAMPAATAAASRAAQEEEDLQASASGAVELDEFGRDANMMKRQEAAERRQRRMQRLQQQAARQTSSQSGAEPRLGEETTDESEGEASHYSARRNEILDNAATVFADASEEFGALPTVKRRLEAWKATQGGAYRDAYMSLSAAAVFAPYVRLELLQWDPIFTGRAGFDDQQWYQQLYDYGMTASFGAGDADEELIPRLVKELVQPLAQHALQDVWSPASRRQSRAAAALVADLLVYVPADDGKMQECLVEVRSKLEEAAEALHLPPWPAAAAQAHPPTSTILARRFGKGLRLLAAVAAFEGVLAREQLMAIALDKLITRQLLPYLRLAAADISVALQRAERLVSTLPSAWFAGGSQKRAEPLLSFLQSLARHVEADKNSAANKQHAQGLQHVLKKLGDAKTAQRLAAAFKLQV